MAVTRSAPWWLGWLLVGGLVSIFLGERVLESVAIARAVLSGVGALVVLGCTVWRALSWRAAVGAARRVEGFLLVACAGCVLALIGYLLSSEDGMRWLSIDFADEEARSRYSVILQVLWTTVLAVSLLPVLGAQLALGQHRHARGEATGVEAFRVVETATGGLVVGLAGAFLFVLGYVASQRDETLDVSYFKTASPGGATVGMVSSLEEPLRVLLFFPDANEIEDEVLRYLRDLADATGRVRIEEHDRFASPRLAEQYQVREDGVMVFVHGDQSELFTVGTEWVAARTRLRALDRNVQRTLFPLLRGRQTVYWTTGHGELNDASSTASRADTLLGRVEAFRELLMLLTYVPRDLGLTGGLGAEVPADAAMVMVLGPRRPFLEEELAALDRYLARGGSLLLALDPGTEFWLGPLEKRLGVRYVPVPLADDQQHLRQQGQLSDRRLIVTNRFSSHEAVTTLARAGVTTGILLVGPGHLQAVDSANAPLFVVRSAATTFEDRSGDFQLDEDTEERDTYNLVAAVERGAPGVEDGAMAPAQGDGAVGSDAGDGSAASDQPMRALVYASSSAFTDAVLVSLAPNAALVADGVKWLGREEALAGSTESEKDVPIVHTQVEDVAWFYATILGAPILVLGSGLFGVYRRRHRRRLDS